MSLQDLPRSETYYCVLIPGLSEVAILKGPFLEQPVEDGAKLVELLRSELSADMEHISSCVTEAQNELEDMRVGLHQLLAEV